jgi:hypothetical protein
MMWRGVTTGPPFLSGATLAVAGSTTSRKFVAYPIARRHDGTVLINWVAEAMIGGTAPPVRPDWLARSLADGGAVAKGPGALAAYEAARRPAVSKIVLANRSMPVDAVLDMVAARAPDGFDRIEDVLDTGELGALRDAYRATSQEDVAALNSRPPILPVSPGIPQM